MARRRTAARSRRVSTRSARSYVVERVAHRVGAAGQRGAQVAVARGRVELGEPRLGAAHRRAHRLDAGPRMLPSPRRRPASGPSAGARPRSAPVRRGARRAARDPEGHAADRAGASRRASRSSSTAIRATATRRPCRSRTGTCRVQPRSTTIPRSPRRSRRGAATIESSIGGVAPVPLTSTTTRSPEPRTRGRRTPCRRSSSTSSSAGRSDSRRTPGSPWMPSPISISSSPSSKPGSPRRAPWPGRARAPIVPTASAAARATAVTSARRRALGGGGARRPS